MSAAGQDTIAVAAHPGGANTELGRHLPAVIRVPAMRLMSQSAQMGALATLRAATDPEVRGGQYYGPGGPGGIQGHPERVESSKQSHDADLQRRLWQVSEELTGITYPID